jgi:hypothetical protein
LKDGDPVEFSIHLMRFVSTIFFAKAGQPANRCAREAA